MANSLDYLAKTILNKTLDDCSVEELSNLSNRYPYFAPAQFLYLKKLDPQSEAYHKQYQKAILFYSNPEQFDFFLNKELYDNALEFPVEEKAIVSNEVLEVPHSEVENTVLPTTTLSVLNTPLTENTITFEPFHTVDYFASQGIKLSQEDASKDKFGKQVKSFTEWLKTMKRLPATQLNNIQGPAEKQVENMAAHSVPHSVCKESKYSFVPDDIIRQ